MQKRYERLLALLLIGASTVYGGFALVTNKTIPPITKREPGRYLDLGKTNILDTRTKTESSVIFNDPAISSKWDLKKTDAEKAWQVSQGSRNIIVAIIDTGCDTNHEDLKNNIWTNPGETGKDNSGRDKDFNKVDDDQNGFIDDAHGWNFVSNNGNLSDNHGHGTHIAGIVGAEGGNNKGIIGIAPKVSMMILKYYDLKTPSDNLHNTVQAIKYATRMNAHIINYSGGGLEFSEEEKKAIQEAQRQGIMFIAAAGNERSNSDKHKYFPADYGLSNIISVTAIDPNTQVLASSNYGVETVDLAAPGQNILSTLPNNSYGYMTGTSQATAFVTGAAAVVMAHKGTFSAEETKKYLLATGDGEESLINKTGTSRKLNLYKALTVLDSGIGLTGIQAANITTDSPSFNADSAFFKTNPSGNRIPSSGSKSGEAKTSLSVFGKSLLEAVQKKPAINKNPGN
jgi:subtilisin family serine protease